MKKNISALLADTPLFSGLSDQQLKEVASIISERQFQKNETIFSEGNDGNGFFIVAEGQVKIFKLSTEGKEKILHIFGPGEPIGEVPVFSGDRFPANAQATAESRLLFVPRDKMMHLVKSNPALSLTMLAVLSQRLREFTVQIENLTLKEVPGRLAAYLIFLARDQGQSDQDQKDQVKLNIAKGQLASLLGTIPETLSRIFAKMTDKGLIEVDGSTIRICDADGLEMLAETGKIDG